MKAGCSRYFGRDCEFYIEAIDASQEAKGCRAAFEKLLWAPADLALHAGNLYRLRREYRRTERRACALKKVLLPEVSRRSRRSMSSST